MPRHPHLFVALSGHGFGHLAQIAPVLNALRRRQSALRLTVQCAIPEAVLRRRIHGDFEYIPEATDVGMVMASAVDTLAPESLAAYRAFHADWKVRLARQQNLLTRLEPDLVFADIPYLPLAAAAPLGIPSVALCSLNWSDILRGYYPGDREVEALTGVMLEAYGGASVFLRPAPSMPMPDLANTRAIGPIAAMGRDRRAAINDRLGLRGDELLVLVALGGVDMRLPMEDWPPMPGVYWLTPPDWRIQRSDALSWEPLADMSFNDWMDSCDVLLTKPGYGAFAEAVCGATPVLYVERADWPEEPWLTRWLLEHGNGLRIDRGTLKTGRLLEPLHALLAQPRRLALEPTGIDEAAGLLEAYLLNR